MTGIPGVTRPHLGSPPRVENPPQHSPLPFKNRVQIVRRSPEGEVIESKTRDGNIMCVTGLNRLCEIIATAVSYHSNTLNWISAMRIGTHTQAEASTDDALGSSTAVIHISTNSMQASDQGSRTLRYVGTFASDNPAGAAAINEVGLFCNSTAESQMAARTMLGTDSVNKGANDQIEISYDIVFTTA